MALDRARSQRGQDGFTVVEIAVVSALFMIVLGVVSTVLWSALRTTTGAQQESNHLEEARVAVTQLERDIRGTTSNYTGPFLCGPTGYCLRLNIQHPDQSTENVRYRLDGTTLYRDRDCTSDFSSCDRAEEMTDTLMNRTLSPSVPAFDCDDADGSPEIAVDLVVGPLQTIGNDQGRVRVDTTVTPRNPFRSC